MAPTLEIFKTNYKNLRNLSEDDIQTASTDFFSELLNCEFARDTFTVYWKVANNTSEDQFLHFITNFELPPIKLTDEEIKAIKGGHAKVFSSRIVEIGLIN